MTFMGIDIGSSGCKSALFDHDGNMLCRIHRAYAPYRNGDNVELDTQEVLTSVYQVIREAAIQATEPVTALACSSIGEAFVPFDEFGKPCGNAVMGADRRGDEAFEMFLQRFGRDRLHQITGNPPGPGYALGTLFAMPDSYKNAQKLLTWSDTIAAELTGVMRFNRSLASRTMLYDRKQRHWAAEIPEAMEISQRYFAPLANAGEVAGTILPAKARELSLSENCQVIVGTHDQCAAAFGSGVLYQNTPMLGLGTYACMVTILPNENNSWVEKVNHEEYIIPDSEVGFIYHGSCGSLIEWVKRIFFHDLDYEQMFKLMHITENLPTVVANFAESGPLEHGLGGNGLIGDLSLEHTREDILSSVLLGILFYFREATKELPPLEKIFVNGGLTNSDNFCQLIADVLERRVELTSPESGLLGSAMVAALGAGTFSYPQEAVKYMAKKHKSFEPNHELKKSIEILFFKYLAKKRALLCT